MAIEIERKFLVVDDSWRAGTAGQKYMQGYLSRDSKATIRVRVTEKGSFLTIKGKPQVYGEKISATKLEYDYPIPQGDAEELLKELCTRPLIEKIRYRINHGGFIWEVDEFLGENTGLVVAEIELETEDQEFPLPPWLGAEVTSESRYYNACLSKTPYSTWKDSK